MSKFLAYAKCYVKIHCFDVIWGQCQEGNIYVRRLPGSQLLVLDVAPDCWAGWCFPPRECAGQCGSEQIFSELVLYQIHLSDLLKSMDHFSSVSPCDYDSVFLGRCQSVF